MVRSVGRKVYVTFSFAKGQNNLGKVDINYGIF